MAQVIKQLGQAAPSNTTATSLFSPGSSQEAIIHNVIICNTTAAAAKYRLFVDDNGTTYDATTALVYDETVSAYTTEVFEVKICMNDGTGNLGVRTDTANALTFTANGVTFS